MGKRGGGRNVGIEDDGGGRKPSRSVPMKMAWLFENGMGGGEREAGEEGRGSDIVTVVAGGATRALN